jgi:hypothetical protein
MILVIKRRIHAAMDRLESKIKIKVIINVAHGPDPSCHSSNETFLDDQIRELERFLSFKTFGQADRLEHI